jgi:hypothetical protein
MNVLKYIWRYLYKGKPLEDLKKARVDTVNKPAHYNNGKVECIEAIDASMTELEFRGYLKGNVLKYVWRYLYKGKPLEDLKKARWYLDRLIESYEQHDS